MNMSSRHTSYATTPMSSLAASQARSTCDDETMVTSSPVGAEGANVSMQTMPHSPQRRIRSPFATFPSTTMSKGAS
jgi:hypothetical protein